MNFKRTWKSVSAVAALALLTAACGEGSDKSAFERPEPTPYQPIIGDDVQASLSAAQLGQLVPDALALAMELDPAAILIAYQQMFALADANCPLVASQGNASYWLDDCTTAAGTHFRGAIRMELYVDVPDADGTTNGFLLSSEGQPLEIEAPDGRWLRGAFFIDARTTQLPNETDYAVYFGGELAADPATAQGNTWLAGGVRGTIGRYAGQTSGGRYLGMSGSFTAAAGGALDAAGITALSFDEFALLDFGCLGELGAISLRDAAGAWHDGVFAPKLEDPPVEVVCDGCGDAFFQKDALGAFCSDTSAFENILYWDTTPW